jgi:hypothetical protein
MKYSQWIGVAASLLLIIACFLPWAYFPDIQKDFTGFFSERNAYGRPGTIFVFLGLLSILFFLVPRVWAKRANLLVGAFIIAFSIKSWLLFSACYRGICPEKRPGLFLLMAASFVMLVAVILPDIKIKDSSK